MSDYAKKCGVGGIFHTDELPPAYGVTAEEVACLREFVGAAEEDCVVIVAAGRERAGCAAEQVMVRAEMGLSGVPPEETRKMLEEGNSAYMRPLPGAARMYPPETDVFAVTIDEEHWESIDIPPELLTDRAERFVREFRLDEGWRGRWRSPSGCRSSRRRSPPVSVPPLLHGRCLPPAGNSPATASRSPG